MSRVWVSGYRSYELGIFQNDDPKLKIIKQALSDQLSQLIESGCDWIITGGQLGIEQWTVEVAKELQQKYPHEFQLAVMLPFKKFGSNWNEDNQAKLHQAITKSDFSDSVSNHPYDSPKQLKNYQRFMLTHTDQALLVYDPENEGKTKYDYQAIQQFQQNHAYPLQLIDFDQLQDIADDYERNLNDDF
ncbi:DUF1273 domain-containing protein [Fructilactobacillus fructivorans]|uniref:UPF0398 protein LfDm3_0731 n=1 Tax=Fructilactobacillus fructivorans TaxID=1614 RepID=A0A0C1M6C4_9LACO|nr:DUF1273 domain-containing protein [Fructilactobacillus fructivorans]KID41769.1 hypothetical protein LfDm3_0731 [Fructilactobacillus fructivorans]MCT0151902.1 DUF1273 domain-containing protein [Fructilactobacillus fructivorans]MCT2868139.1 DUF1273 domain-containing protein [Fructilactobacillus fructivorans]MCT2869411.1 DUF1273 domain-containing protein [Fructilactobacillus fructivorans]MCT2874111.1 DUF1273 domain-containing protein [Fructilactobacillus fructivorans]